MGSIKERYGKNYILCDTDGKGKIRNPLQIVKSWENKVNYITEDVAKEQVGLRKAQLGAIFAIRAHWTTSALPATVVMPTGTGKTETMITTIIAEQCKKVFILVPSNLLRTQTVINCSNLGILKDIGVIDSKAKLPNVLCLCSCPATESDLERLIDKSNIIVTTASLAGRFSDTYMEILSNKCDTFIVDEAHHIKANNWEKIKACFITKRILQFTATPFRNDGKRIDGEIIYNFPLSQAQEQGYFKKINFLTFWIYSFSSITLICVINTFIEWWASKEYIFPMSIVCILILNFYINGMRKSIIMFREAAGLFYKDRWKSIIEALVNLFISIILGIKFGTIGVFIGTTISAVTVSLWLEPLILYKYSFKKNLSNYFKTYLKYFSFTVIVALCVSKICNYIKFNLAVNLIIKLLICTIVVNLFIIVCFRKTEEYKYVKEKILKNIIKRVGK